MTAGVPRAARRRGRASPDPAGELGDTVVGTFAGTAGGPRLLLIGHMDTVFDPGTAAERPFRSTSGHRPWPGRHRHEGGLLAGLYALGARRRAAASPAVRAADVRRQPRRGDRLADARRRTSATSPRTPTSRSCSSAPGRTATSCRPGRASPTCGSRSTGRAAHAGVEPEKGRSAILEAAAHRPRPPRAQRPLAGRDGQRRRHRGRHARRTSSRRSATLEVDVRAVARRGARWRPRPRSASSPRRPRCRTRPSRSRPRLAGGRWRSSSDPAGWSTHAQARRPRLGLRGRRRRDRRRVGREHDRGHGRADTRRPGPDRRQRPLAGGVPRGRLDRAADRAAGRAAAGDRARPGGPRLAATDAARRREPPARSRRAGRGRRPPATAGRSSSATRAGSRARPMPDRTAVAPPGRRRGARRGRSSAIIEQALAEAGFALARRRPDADVRRPTSRDRDGRSAVHGERFAEIRPASTLVEVAGADALRACSSRSRPRRAARLAGRPVGSAASPVGAARTSDDRDRPRR